jgi:hypothetical protein
MDRKWQYQLIQPDIDEIMLLQTTYLLKEQKIKLSTVSLW